MQNYRTGEVRVAEVPAPACPSNGVLVQTVASLVSVGTERSMIELGRKSLLGKARARPDLVKRAMEKGRREGFWKTFQEATARLDTPVPLGYSLAGKVIECGPRAHGFTPGDRVACVGHPFASHAEFAAVPANLVSRLPSGVSEENGAFGMLGAIAMHGVRSTNLGLGGCVAVIGLGLLGNLAAQILRAYGCRVVGMDLDPGKVNLCRTLGLSDVVLDAQALEARVHELSRGLGCDAVVIAVASRSADPVNLAVRLCRSRARIVVLGVADIHPDRNELWHKEVEILVSKAGGIGALDPIYELDGIDLPIGIARWTQGRNLEEFLSLLDRRRIDVNPLITHRRAIEDAGSFYSDLISGKLQDVVAPLLTYDIAASPTRTRSIGSASPPRDGIPNLAVLGGGQFARTVLLPAIAKVGGAVLQVLATRSGTTAEHLARKYGFQECTTDSKTVFDRSDVDAVIAPLPHAAHAATVLSAIAAQKPLLIEKPLCVSLSELVEIEKAIVEAVALPLVLVGHNRRYSSHTVRMREWLAQRTQPLVMTIRVNAGQVPSNHWVHSDREGRSRIVGECSHFVDLAQYLAQSRINVVSAMRIRGDDRTVVNNDNFVATFSFEDGSIASLAYTSQGPRATARESIEVFSSGSVIQCADFRITELVGLTGDRKRYRTGSQDYGYEQEIRHFLASIKGEAILDPDPVDAIHTMRCTFAIEDALATGTSVAIAS